MNKNGKWTAENIPDQSGKIIIITGANNGLGFVDAKELSGKGAQVIMACRNLEKANDAKEKILEKHPGASLDIMELNLADFDSIKKFAAGFSQKYQKLDVLINNAGVMMPPYQKTKQGFELQFGTNYLGHFMLTGLLLSKILKTPNSRIVNVSSALHNFGSMNFDDLNWEKSYNKIKAYGRSKLSNLLFTYELQRKLSATGKDTICLASHPGWATTNLQRTSFFRFFNWIFGQSPETGALPTLYAAVSPDAEGGKYYGPSGFMERSGAPKEVDSNKESKSLEEAKKLWDISVQLTGINFDFQ